MTSEPPLTLVDGMRLSRLSYSELWIRCLALGGAGTVSQLQRHVKGDDYPDDQQHNIIAQALNDRYLEQGHNRSVGYRQLHRRDT